MRAEANAADAQDLGGLGFSVGRLEEEIECERYAVYSQQFFSDSPVSSEAQSCCLKVGFGGVLMGADYTRPAP